MAFESVNELDRFSYEDAHVIDIKLDNGDLVVTLEALIVKAANSQNSNYTDSYADEAVMILRGASIISLVEEGYKLYDADDNLTKEVPDTPLPLCNIEREIKKLTDGYMFSVEQKAKDEKGYVFIIETDMGTIDENGVTDPYAVTYEMEIRFSEARISWEKYLNRVQK